jgi:adenine-specific DNA-methyltransferase
MTDTLLDLKKLDNLSTSKRTSELVKKIRSILDETLDYEYQISKYADDYFLRDDVEEYLGQVKTPIWAAKLISYLCIKQPKQRVLDPCFGDGIFLESAHNRINELKHTTKPDLWGVEIDLVRFAEGLQNFSKKKRNFNNSFFCGDIFDFKEKTFDCIVMNPPYIRQEKLLNQNPDFMNKKILHEKIKDLFGITLSLRSNLYIYFIMYVSSLLKNGGRMGIIIPKGWLDSKHGEEFQKFLLNVFEIEFIIDFAKDSFNNVIVEDCILILKKEKNSSNNIRFVHICKEPDEKIFKKILDAKVSFETKKVFVSIIKKNILIKDHKWGKFFYVNSKVMQLLNAKNLVPLSKFAEIRRGIETNWNEFFILDEKKKNQFNIPDEFLTKIISSPKQLKKLDTKNDVNFDYLLSINTQLDLSDKFLEISKYVNHNYKIFSKKQNNSVLKKQNTKNIDSWYQTKIFKPSPLIFSYIIRNSKFFIKNSKEYLVRDNFYNIFPKKTNTDILFALLNSSFSRLQLELIGRRYGNGILKIQVYELQEIKLPDIRIMSKQMKQELIDESKKLSSFTILNNESTKIIDKIDLIVQDFCELKLTLKELKKIEKQMLETRLMRGQ